MIDAVDASAAGPPPDLKRTRREKRPSPALLRTDRLPPHSEEAERGVLGCMLLDPQQVVPSCITKFKAASEAFYNGSNQALFELLVEMDQRNEPIDVVTVHQRLKDKKQLEAVGGANYLNDLQNSVPSAANWSYYADIVREKHMLRRMISTCSAVVGRLYDSEGEVDQLMDEAERDVLRACEDRVETTLRPIKELVHHSITQIEQRHQNQGMMDGIATGFDDLDKLTTGMHAGEMIVIAARPSMGKTSLAMNIAENVAMDQGLPVGVFSLEMTAEALVMRMLCSRARVNLRNVREGFLAERDFPRLTNTASKLSKAPLFIDDTSGLSIIELRAKARRMHQQHGIKLVIIDYLQLLRSTAASARDNRQQEIADISNGVKALAKELRIPVIVLAQLNREMEKDKSRKPRLSDLRESGAIEQDADLVCLLYKPKSGEEEDDGGGGAEREDSHDGLPVNLLIAKQRNGPTGDVHLTFLKGFTRFETAAKVSGDDVP